MDLRDYISNSKNNPMKIKLNFSTSKNNPLKTKLNFSNINLFNSKYGSL